MDDRIVSSGFRQGDDEQEQSLRPKTLREYIGQEKAKDNLAVFIQAAQKRGEALDHVGNRWIISSFTARPDWARLRWRALSPLKWGRTSASPAARPLSDPAIWPAF